MVGHGHGRDAYGRGIVAVEEGTYGIDDEDVIVEDVVEGDAERRTRPDGEEDAPRRDLRVVVVVAETTYGGSYDDGDGIEPKVRRKAWGRRPSNIILDDGTGDDAIPRRGHDDVFRRLDGGSSSRGRIVVVVRTPRIFLPSEEMDEGDGEAEVVIPHGGDVVIVVEDPESVLKNDAKREPKESNLCL